MRMLQAMNASTLFAGDLTGTCDAARKAWRLPPDEPAAWTAGLIVDRPSKKFARARRLGTGLLTHHQYAARVRCRRTANEVEEVARRLRCALLPLPETSTVHCSVVHEVAEAYRRLHLLPTSPPPNVRFYSAALGRTYELSEDSAADAILAQALDTIDFPAVIEAAYRDGARLFVEMGPGASCSRMIGAVLGDRPHRARSICAPGTDGTPALLRVLGMLIAERVGVDLTPLYGAKPHAEVPSEERTIAIPIGGEPFVVPLASGGRKPPDSMSYYRKHEESGGLRPPLASLLAESVATCEAHGHAHAAFLRYTDSVRQTVIDSLAFQTSLLESLQNGSAD